MYNCSTTGINTKVKLIAFSIIGITVATTTYFLFTATNSGATLSLPGIIGLVACPMMCAAIGGLMWIGSRFLNRKNQKVNPDRLDSNLDSCCSGHSHFRSHDHHKANFEI